LTASDVAARRAEVLRLRAAGLTYQQLADQLGYPTPAAAALDVSRALKARKALLDRQAGDLATLELERLDALERRLQTVLADAAQAKDHATIIAASDRLLRVVEARRKLADAAPRRHGPAAAPARGKLTPGDRRDLVRALAGGEVTRSDLARTYSVSAPYITQFARAHAIEIGQVRAHLDDDVAGLWIASKQARMAAYQDDVERTLNHEHAGHHEWVKARSGIFHNVAEELGQLPPKATIMVVPVVHVLEGVDTDALT
jgi:hypothetical protein